MNNWNFEALKENIRKHMSDKGMTQKDVAKALNTSQANIAKHLKKGDDAQTFTLKQVWQLADLFGTSIDELLGRESNMSAYTPVNLCKFLMTLVEKGIAEYTTHHVEQELVWRGEPNNGNITKDIRKAEYIAFYFPDYMTCKNIVDYIRFNDIHKKGINSSLDNMLMNEYLKRIVEAYDKYNSGDFNKEIYEIVSTRYMDMLENEINRYKELQEHPPIIS